ALVRGVKELGKQYGFEAVCYGHAGDGNLHIRINHPSIKNSHGNAEMNKALADLFRLVHSLGGTISGEHGVGLIQKPYLDTVFKQQNIELMRGIKRVFDPNNILNAGKIFDLA
ncbi:MAG TPA: FAD-linked oxidase C-terminal domain-containing protein, partial [Sediminibacterium sp.]